MRAILACRETRVQRRKELQHTYRLPAVQLTMNIPGACKSSFLYEQAHAVGEAEFLRECEMAGWEIAHREGRKGACGRETVFLMKAEPVQLKRLCVHIETEHQIGRLFDFDVFTADGGVVDRESLQLPQRKCFLCDLPARECARQRTHSTDLLLKSIKESISSFLQYQGEQNVGMD